MMTICVVTVALDVFSMLVFVAFILSVVACSRCPDLHKFRTNRVLKSFNATKLAGKWYEVAYMDIA